MLAHNADKIIILGEKNLALQYRNYFKANGVKAYVDVQPVDLARDLRDRVKIMFFSSKATKDDEKLQDDREIYPSISPIEEPSNESDGLENEGSADE